jgi:hypothetical protein
MARAAIMMKKSLAAGEISNAALRRTDAKTIFFPELPPEKMRRLL